MWNNKKKKKMHVQTHHKFCSSLSIFHLFTVNNTYCPAQNDSIHVLFSDWVKKKESNFKEKIYFLEESEITPDTQHGKLH